MGLASKPLKHLPIPLLSLDRIQRLLQQELLLPQLLLLLMDMAMLLDMVTLLLLMVLSVAMVLLDMLGMESVRLTPSLLLMLKLTPMLLMVMVMLLTPRWCQLQSVTVSQSSSAGMSPSAPPGKLPRPCVPFMLMCPPLKTVRKSSQPSVARPHRRLLTILLWLVMTPGLDLLQLSLLMAML